MSTVKSGFSVTILSEQHCFAVLQGDLVRRRSCLRSSVDYGCYQASFVARLPFPLFGDDNFLWFLLYVKSYCHAADYCHAAIRPWWHCLMDKNLLVFLSTEDNSDQIPNTICSNAALNLQETSTMLHCCLQTLILIPLSSPSTNKLPFSVQSTCCCACDFMHRWAVWLFLHIWVMFSFFLFYCESVFSWDHLWPEFSGL